MCSLTQCFLPLLPPMTWVLLQAWGESGRQEHRRLDPADVRLLYRPWQHCQPPAGGWCECQRSHSQRVDPLDAGRQLWQWKHRLLPASGTASDGSLREMALLLAALVSNLVFFPTWSKALSWSARTAEDGRPCSTARAQDTSRWSSSCWITMQTQTSSESFCWSQKWRDTVGISEHTLLFHQQGAGFRFYSPDGSFHLRTRDHHSVSVGPCELALAWITILLLSHFFTSFVLMKLHHSNECLFALQIDSFQSKLAIFSSEHQYRQCHNMWLSQPTSCFSASLLLFVHVIDVAECVWTFPIMLSYGFYMLH